MKSETYPRSPFPGRTYVNSALIYHLHSSHLQFSTPLPPPPVHLLRRLDALNTTNNFELLNINILISLFISETNGSFRYCTIMTYIVQF